MPNDPLTLADVAHVLGAGETKIPEATHGRLAPHLRSDPRVAEQVRELERLAREAGSDSLYLGFVAHGLFEELLAWGTGWSHPVQVVSPRKLEACYPALLHIAGARAEHAEDPGPLLDLRQRLERARGDLGSYEELLKSFVDRLMEVDHEIALRILGLLGQEYRERLGVRNWWDELPERGAR